MSSPSGSTGASQRASEINSAMLNVPGYADDSMLFVMRYGALAKETLRKVDWDEFQLRLSAMNTHWYKSHRGKTTAIGAGSDDSIVDVGSRGTGEGDGANTAAVAAASDAKDSPIATAAATCDAVDPASVPGPEAAELKARTLELIQDFPGLVRDFDRFVECTRIMATRYKR
ncbi:uncharacterized protein TrAFT101_003151 [Trichoderma asperellum]|uniref:uncharacterized protein n=1 Tax=Trichoderma asperellum TaxID=101201 RepID=UPI00332FDE24|nr:hypothetical protein TrAFT101_003151 [Trichoderma asperellum]